MKAFKFLPILSVALLSAALMIPTANAGPGCGSSDGAKVKAAGAKGSSCASSAKTASADGASCSTSAKAANAGGACCPTGAKAASAGAAGCASTKAAIKTASATGCASTEAAIKTASAAGCSAEMAAACANMTAAEKEACCASMKAASASACATKDGSYEIVYRVAGVENDEAAAAVVAAVKNLGFDGIEACDVNAETAQATVRCSGNVCKVSVQKAITGAGYPAELIVQAAEAVEGAAPTTDTERS